MNSGAPYPTRHRYKFSRRKDGCLSCRNRRKKCDGRKPVCGLCLRSRAACQWPNLERNQETGTTFDVCTSLPVEAHSETCRPKDRRCASDDICPGDENIASGDNYCGDTSKSVPLHPSKMCNMSRDSATDFPKANYGHVPEGCRRCVPCSHYLNCRDRSCVPSFATITSPAANRVQLFNTFLSTYIPSNVTLKEREGSVYLMYFGFIEELARARSSHPVLTAATNALSLVSVGCMIKDPEMLRKSSEEYSVSVKRLAAAVQQPDSVHDEDLLAAIMVLATCELYEPFKQKSQAQGYYSHITGLHSLLAARGPLPPKSRLTSFVLAKAKASSITKSMFSHQEDFHAGAGWRELKLNVPSLDQDRSYELGVRMSRLFASSDQLDLDGPRSLREIDNLLQDGACLERDLRSDLDHHLASAWSPTGLSVTLEDIGKFPRYCSLVANRTLLKAYRFESYPTAYRYTSFWLRKAMLRTVIKMLQAKRCLLSTDDLPTFACGFGKPVTESELRQYVLCVCRNLPFFAEPACVSSGDVCSFFPLSFAAEYFAKCNDAKWSAWVEDVRKHLFVRGVSFPLAR